MFKDLSLISFSYFKCNGTQGQEILSFSYGKNNCLEDEGAFSEQKKILLEIGKACTACLPHPPKEMCVKLKEGKRRKGDYF